MTKGGKFLKKNVMLRLLGFLQDNLVLYQLSL